MSKVEATVYGDRRVFAVSAFNRGIAAWLGKLPDVWVEGELSNYKTSTAGHLYFTLKDDRAQLPAVCFRNSARLLRFRPENGKLFRARGRVSEPLRFAYGTIPSAAWQMPIR